MKPYPIYLIFLINLLGITSVSATSLLPISLEQLSTRAELIFYGTVLSNQVKKDGISGHIATFTEFEIIETIKDNTGTKNKNSHTIKQLGGRLQNSQTSLRVHGVPKFQLGEQYVVFLPKKSSLGFCSPLGLHQGSFAVTIVNGEKVISNGHQLAQQSSKLASAKINNNSTAQLPLAVNSSDPTQANLGDFINSVRALIAQ